MSVRWAVVAAVLPVVLAAFTGCASQIAPAAPPREVFDPPLVRQGAQLAAIGDCAGCHTRSGGAPLAGGVALATPFGTIYGSNITPDEKFGIGAWSEEAFRRAMREGVSRDGRHLYPAFPYEHFTLLSDDDLHALYAYLMTRQPVATKAPDNELRFPYNLRPLLAGWKALYFREARYQPDETKSAEWNRGAYLVEGLGHCGACHTPRNRLGAEQKNRALSGGMIEGWYAPALDAASPSPVPWTPEALATYLSTGIAERHAIAGGPMQTVTHELGYASPADVRAIAGYIVSSISSPTKPSVASAASGAGTSQPDAALQLGKTLYAGACASCHDAGRGVSSDTALELPLAVAVHDPEPASLIRIIEDGIRPPEGEPGRWMPGFRGTFTDQQLAALVAYLRSFAK
jgi:mono/diheme cytochrome c family protein